MLISVLNFSVLEADVCLFSALEQDFSFVLDLLHAACSIPVLSMFYLVSTEIQALKEDAITLSLRHSIHR